MGFSTTDRGQLISRELGSVRQELNAGMPDCPDDVEALAKCIHEKCFDTDFDVNAALEHCSVRSGSMYSKFKRFFGWTPGKYLEWCRLTGARRLLAFPRLQVTEIGFRIGYENRESFSRAFARNCGHPPSKYQAKAMHPGNMSGDGSAGVPSDENSIMWQPSPPG